MNTLQLVIPTLWQPASLTLTLERYLHSQVVDRLIVIDNDPSSRPAAVESLRQHPRLLLLSQHRNLFVNPAWNLGMEQIQMASSLVGILNDDIMIPGSVLERLLDQDLGAGTVVGLLPPSQNATSFALEPFAYRPDVSIGSQCRGFGSALFLHRRDYVPIPDTLKIWFGDDWILQRASRVLGLRSAAIAIERHITMASMRRSPAFREQLAHDKRLAGTLLGWEQAE